jgi:hypothetical protein
MTRNVSWLAALLLLASASAFAAPQSSLDRELTPDASVPIPALKFDAAGSLVIEASPTSSVKDFDYLVGHWNLHNRKLKSRLTGSTEWLSFVSKVEMRPILEGVGNIDKYTENTSGKHYEGVALRLFDTQTRLWSIYWADSNSGALDPPVVGSFANQIGHFFARDTFKGQPIVVVFRWDVRNPQRPIWSQAFSNDEGKTWEWNAINVSERARQ